MFIIAFFFNLLIKSWYFAVCVCIQDNCYFENTLLFRCYSSLKGMIIKVTQRSGPNNKKKNNYSSCERWKPIHLYGSCFVNLASMPPDRSYVNNVVIGNGSYLLTVGINVCWLTGPKLYLLYPYFWIIQLVMVKIFSDTIFLLIY